jgi:hypothetical protein
MAAMSADRKASMLWWLGFLSAFSIPVLAALGIAAYGHAYPGSLRTSIANWGGTLAWVVGAVIAVRQLNVARKAPLLRSIARIAIVLGFGFSAVSLHFISTCESRSEYVGGPGPQQSRTGTGRLLSQASCP